MIDRDILITPVIATIKPFTTTEIPSTTEATSIFIVDVDTALQVNEGYIDDSFIVKTEIQSMTPIVNDTIFITNDITAIDVSEEDADIVIPKGYNDKSKQVFFISEIAEIISKGEIDDVNIQETEEYEIQFDQGKANFKNKITISGKTLTKILKSGRALATDNFGNPINFSTELSDIISSLTLFVGNYDEKKEE